jgi:hypothetical protein
MADRHTHGPYAISAPRAKSQTLSRPSKLTTSTSFEFGNSNRPAVRYARTRSHMPLSAR